SDSKGNKSTIDFVFTLDTKAPTITLTSPTTNATLTAGKRLTGKAIDTGSAVTALSYSFDTGQSIPIAFTSTGAFDEPLDLSKLIPGPHVLNLTATDAAGNSTTFTRNVTLPSAIPLTITATSVAVRLR